MWYFIVFMVGAFVGIVGMSCLAMASDQERCQECFLNSLKSE